MDSCLNYSGKIRLSGKRVSVTVAAISVALLLLSLYFHPLVYLLLLIHVIYIMVAEERDSINLAYFLLSFASIYKVSPGTMSFFTIFEVFLVAWFVVKRQRFSAWTIVGCLGLFAVMLFAPKHDFLDSARVLLTLIIFSLLSRREDCDTSSIVLHFALGLILSSLLALLKGYIPNLTAYFAVSDSYTTSGQPLRFAGMYADPNYYAVNLMTCNFSMLTLYSHKKIGNVFWVATILFAFFGLLTMSKSLIIVLLLYLFLLVWTLATGRKRVVALFVVAAIAVFAGYFLFSDNTLFVLVRSRFVFNNVDSLTTGRLSAMKRYVEHIGANLRVSLCGEGLGSSLLFVRGKYRASHNLYIDLVYYFGLIGTSFYIGTLAKNWSENRKRIKREINNYSTICCVLVMYFFLSAVIMVELPFLLSLGLYVYNDEEISCH